MEGRGIVGGRGNIIICEMRKMGGYSQMLKGRTYLAKDLKRKY